MIVLLAALICSLFAGCSIETKIQSGTEESKYSFYYLNASETVLKEEPYEPKEETTEFMVKDLMQKLGKKEVPDGGVSLLPEEVSINSYDVQDDLLVIDFSKEYSDMSKCIIPIAFSVFSEILCKCFAGHFTDFFVS